MVKKGYELPKTAGLCMSTHPLPKMTPQYKPGHFQYVDNVPKDTHPGFQEKLSEED